MRLENREHLNYPSASIVNNSTNSPTTTKWKGKEIHNNNSNATPNIISESKTITQSTTDAFNLKNTNNETFNRSRTENTALSRLTMPSASVHSSSINDHSTKNAAFPNYRNSNKHHNSNIITHTNRIQSASAYSIKSFHDGSTKNSDFWSLSWVRSQLLEDDSGGGCNMNDHTTLENSIIRNHNNSVTTRVTPNNNNIKRSTSTTRHTDGTNINVITSPKMSLQNIPDVIAQQQQLEQHNTKELQQVTTTYNNMDSPGVAPVRNHSFASCAAIQRERSSIPLQNNRSKQMIDRPTTSNYYEPQEQEQIQYEERHQYSPPTTNNNLLIKKTPSDSRSFVGKVQNQRRKMANKRRQSKQENVMKGDMADNNNNNMKLSVEDKEEEVEENVEFIHYLIIDPNPSSMSSITYRSSDFRVLDEPSFDYMNEELICCELDNSFQAANSENDNNNCMTQLLPPILEIESPLAVPVTNAPNTNNATKELPTAAATDYGLKSTILDKLKHLCDAITTQLHQDFTKDHVTTTTDDDKDYQDKDENRYDNGHEDEPRMLNDDEHRIVYDANDTMNEQQHQQLGILTALTELDKSRSRSQATGNKKSIDAQHTNCIDYACSIDFDKPAILNQGTTSTETTGTGTTGNTTTEDNNNENCFCCNVDDLYQLILEYKFPRFILSHCFQLNNTANDDDPNAHTNNNYNNVIHFIQQKYGRSLGGADHNNNQSSHLESTSNVDTRKEVPLASPSLQLFDNKDLGNDDPCFKNSKNIKNKNGASSFKQRARTKVKSYLKSVKIIRNSVTTTKRKNFSISNATSTSTTKTTSSMQQPRNCDNVYVRVLGEAVKKKSSSSNNKVISKTHDSSQPASYIDKNINIKGTKQKKVFTIGRFKK